MQQIKQIENYHFFAKLKALPFVNRIIVYGSRARGDNQERSDMDLAVSCSKHSKHDWLQVTAIIEEADTLLKIDCVCLEDLAENSPLLKSIKQDGQILFERKTDNG